MIKLKDIKIVSRNGYPKAVFRFDSDGKCVSYTYRKGTKTKIKTLYKHSAYEYIIEMPVSIFEDFIEINPKICGDYSDIKFDQDSINTYYGFRKGNNMCCLTNLTAAYINTWVGYDCPDLFRYTVNIDRHPNWAGINLLVFEDVLYSYSGIGTTTVDDLEEKEYNAFKKAMDHQWYCWQKIEEAYHNQNYSGELEKIKEDVLNYENHIQNIINIHQSELLKYSETLSEKAMDCGFTYLFTNNGEIANKISLLKTKGIRESEDLCVKFPDDYSSISNSELIFHKFKELAKGDKIINELFIRTVLD